MIELTPGQRNSLPAGGGEARLIDPVSRREYVLVPAEVFERLRALYDDSPWTDEEMDLLAAESGDSLEAAEEARPRP